MIAKGFILKTSTAGIVFSATLLGTQTGCVGYVDRADTGRMYAVSPVVETTFVIEDDYVYYPSYQIYYSSRRHQYAYRDGHNWISRPAPHGVSLNRLQASPSVRMEFHDSPAQHHEAVTQQYPKNWSPPRANPERKENRKNDDRDQHGENHGR
jgi:hypothetical protein